MITIKELTKVIEDTLKAAGISVLPDNLDEKSKVLIEAGIEAAEDLSTLDKKALIDYLGIKPLQVPKVLKAFNKIGQEEEEELSEEDIEIPTRPTNLSAFTAIAVTGNLNIELDVVNAYIEIAMLRNLGIESVAEKLHNLLEAKMQDFGTSATTEIVKAYKVLMKFKQTDPAVLAMLGSEYFLINSRHETIDLVADRMFPAIIEFVNDALALRLEIADFNTILFKNIAKVKNVGNEINETTVTTAVEELATLINRDLNSMHPIVAKQTVTLYQEVFALLNNKELQLFLGATDSRTMFQQLGIQFTPKEVTSFEQFPELVYGILSVLDNATILQSDQGIYKYLQKIWSNARTIQWAKLGTVMLSNASSSNAEKAEVLGITTYSENTNQGTVL